MLTSCFVTPCNRAGLFDIPYLFNKAESKEDTTQNSLSDLEKRVKEVYNTCNDSMKLLNISVGLAHNANSASINAFDTSKKTKELVDQASKIASDISIKIDQINETQVTIEERVNNSFADLKNECDFLKKDLEKEVEKRNAFNVAQEIEKEKAKIQEKQRAGIYEQSGRIKAQASIEKEKARWDKIREMITDPIFIGKVTVAIVIIALGIYTIKYGIPLVIDTITQPRVISETSIIGWFDWFSDTPHVDINDLFFSGSLQQQLTDLLLRVQTAKNYGENLPNVLFYGPSGTGKTAFAKALAYNSGMDYALTSGSEFAKITDLTLANDELRKFLNWAQRTDNGLIVFIDEAESLFASRKFESTPKITQDFINTFLSIVPEQSQKKIMFIFGTNHPSKLDSAITNRIGIQIPFTLPAAPEREKILLSYLTKYAQDNQTTPVIIPSEIIFKIPEYVTYLEGFSPRTIKFIAEAMIIKARREESKQLSDEIIGNILDIAIRQLQQEVAWEKERENLRLIFGL